MRRLTNATAPALSDHVTVPTYDRSAITPGIVHLGVGAFHRAHQAPLVDDCLSRGEHTWGIVAASLRSTETRDALMPQDCLYTLAIQEGDTRENRVVGSIANILVGPEDPSVLLEILADPQIRIVTLTVTEKGYTAKLANCELRLDHPDVVHDQANPTRPRSALGFLVEAIRLRRERAVAPFTVLSCDNIPSNGKTLKALLVQFADIGDADLTSYIRESVSCPSCMVDRIVPATTDQDRAEISGSLGVEDSWPVVTEPFWQWVVEDTFPSGRPRLELSGVEFVEDVKPHENMKIRMLNGAHTTIAAIGRVAGLATVHEVYADNRVRNFIDAYFRQVEMTLADGVDSEKYKSRLSTRFSNTALQHRTEQIAMDASQKLPQRIIAPLADLTDAGQGRSLLLFALAIWIRSCMPTNEPGDVLIMNDPLAQQLSVAVAQDDPETIVDAIFQIDGIFDPRWPSDQAARHEVTRFLECIQNEGVLDAIQTMLGLPISDGQRARLSS